MKKTEQGMRVLQLMRDLVRTELTMAILEAERIKHRINVSNTGVKLTPATIGDRFISAIDALATHASETQAALVAELERLP